MLWKGTIRQYDNPREDPIQVFLFGGSTYPLFQFIMMEFSSGGNIQEKSSSAISGLVHVSQLRIYLVHWKLVLDPHKVLWILI